MLATFAAAQAQNTGVTRFVRFSHRGHTAQAIQEGDELKVIQGDMLGSYKVTSTKHKLSEVKLLYPITPSKALAVGLNYKSHLGTRTPPSQPEIFYKPITCLQNPGDPIRIPKDAKNVHYEGELVVVIGKRLSGVSPGEAAAGIFGVTCGNDVSERDWQNGPQKDLQWWRAKGADTFGPIGPYLVTKDDVPDPNNLAVHCSWGGETIAEDSTAYYNYPVHETIAFMSRYHTLFPGDIISMGTAFKPSPGSKRSLHLADLNRYPRTVTMAITGLGTLINPVEKVETA